MCVVVLMTGTIVRFDEVRGYGFIAPDEGQEDVFMHANDLLEEKYLYQAGRQVEFFVEGGERGPKASEIRLVRRPSGASGGESGATPAAPAPRRAEQDDEYTCDVLSAREFRAEVTESLFDADGSLTAAQMQRVRTRLLELAKRHGWVSADER